MSVFGHWFSILKQVLAKDNPALMKAADAYLRLGITTNEAVISCWKTKYTHHQIRPVTYIRKHMGYADWNPLISTPPHPEYSAAHGTISGSAGYALESVFGPNYSFTDHTYDVLGMSPRTFGSFDVFAPNTALRKPYSSCCMVTGISPGKNGKYCGESSKTVGLTALIRIPFSSSMAHNCTFVLSAGRRPGVLLPVKAIVH